MKTKRTMITAAVLALCLALLAAVYFIIKGNSDSGAAREAEKDEKIVLVSRDRSELSALRYKNDDGEISLERSMSGSWRLSENPDFPVDRGAVDRMIEAVTALSADRKLESEQPSYGLETPSITFTALWSDGTENSFAVGAENNYNGLSRVYIKDLDTGSVYLADSTVASALSCGESDLLSTFEMPGIDAESVVSLKVSDGGASVTVTDPDELAGCLEAFTALDFSKNGAEFADGDKLASLGFTASSPSAELTYSVDDVGVDTDGNETAIKTKETVTVVFGGVKEKEDASHITERYYSLLGERVVYLTDETNYINLMNYLKG